MDDGVQFYTAANLPVPGESQGQRIRALEPAMARAYGAREYVGQESFVTASEVLTIAHRMGITASSKVLDLCCGTGGLTRHLAASMGCGVVGVDRSFPAAHRAQGAASIHSPPVKATFLAAEATRLPFAGPFDAALLIETMLAIADKGALLTEVHRVLRPRGRFGLTLEDGLPLDEAEQRALSSGHRVWLIPAESFSALVSDRQFRLIWQEDHTAQHAKTANRLLKAYERHRAAITEHIGADLCEQIIADHRIWVRWLTTRRVRKLALVIERMSR